MEGDGTVLLAVMGTSPAVLTETVWALAHETPPVVPEQVIVLTTLPGRAAIQRELFEGEMWERLRFRLGRQGMPTRRQPRFGLSAEHIRLFPSADGSCDINDILTAEDALAVGDTILRTLRAFTAVPSTRVIASIAGGRKTMSSLLTSGMTLLGRRQDRLCHVLVNPPFDSPALDPPFFFPGSAKRYELPGTGKSFKPTEACVQLVDIPFVRLCEASWPWSDPPATYAGMVQATQRRLAGVRVPRIRFSVRGGVVFVDETPIRLTDLEFAVALAIGRQHAAGKILTRWGEIMPEIETLHAKEGVPAEVVWLHDFQARPMPDEKEDIRKCVSRIREKFRNAGVSAGVVTAFLPHPRKQTEPYPHECMAIADEL